MFYNKTKVTETKKLQGNLNEEKQKWSNIKEEKLIKVLIAISGNVSLALSDKGLLCFVFVSWFSLQCSNEK